MNHDSKVLVGWHITRAGTPLRQWLMSIGQVPEGHETWPRLAGTYSLHRDGEYLYIGSSANLLHRVLVEDRRLEVAFNRADDIMIRVFCCVQHAALSEAEMIHDRQPKYNAAHVDVPVDGCRLCGATAPHPVSWDTDLP